MKKIKAIFKAIKKINPNAQASMSGEDINTLVWENGTQPINKQDILDLVPECLAEIETEEQAKINAKQSAISKLKAIGLTDEEIKALIGI
jgi:DNA-binding transcriptional regulator YhcF (GntR family)